MYSRFQGLGQAFGPAVVQAAVATQNANSSLRAGLPSGMGTPENPITLPTEIVRANPPSWLWIAGAAVAALLFLRR